MKTLKSVKEGIGMKKCNSVLQDVLEDIKIVELYFNRDEKAIIETDAKYGKLLFKIAYNILGNKSDCEECLNDIYLGIWNAIPPTNPNSFCSFISQIARNIAINKYKENSAKKRIPS